MHTPAPSQPLSQFQQDKRHAEHLWHMQAQPCHKMTLDFRQDLANTDCPVAARIHSGMHAPPKLQQYRTASGCRHFTHTCEQLHDEQTPNDTGEDRVPDPAAALVAALVDVQHLVPPKHPGPQEVQEAEGQYDGRAGRVCQSDDVEQHYGSDLAAVPDGSRRQACHLLVRSLGGCNNTVCTLCVSVTAEKRKKEEKKEEKKGRKKR